MSTKKEEIKSLIEFAKNSKNAVNKKILINEIGLPESQQIFFKTGFNLLGYKRVLDKFGINHTLKNHGVDKTEKIRGQIAVTENDFLLIPEIVKTENVIYSGKNKTGNDTLLYEYIKDNTFYYVEEIRNGRKELCLKTMYKRKPTIKK